MIYMDNAATSYPKPQSVEKAVVEALDIYGANPGRSSHKFAVETALALYRAREAVADFFNTVPENVVFTYNATYALNMAILGMVKHGQNVCTSVFEHNSVLRPLWHLEKEKGIKITYLKPSLNADEKIISDFEKLVKSSEKPQFLILTHTSNVTGYKMPVWQLGRICKRENITFILDASQGVGTSEIDMDKMGVDILCASGHKGLFGIGGSGLFVMGKDSKVSVTPIFSGGSGVASREKEMPSSLPERLEAGTVSVVGAQSVKAGIEYINREGIDSLSYKTFAMQKRLVEGISVLSTYDLIWPQVQSSSIVLFNSKKYSSEELSSILDDYSIASRSGLHCAPLAHDYIGTHDGAVRLSLSCFNTFSECEMVLKVLREIEK